MKRMSNVKSKSLVLIQLNEINFDLIERYIDQGASLPYFSALLREGVHTTEAESEYSHLEPWIQWPSIYTGLPFSGHGIFRLGDSQSLSGSQVFEVIERRGYSVGCIAPMNAVNAMANPKFFVCDPWTDTPSDSSLKSKLLSKSIRSLVNKNASDRKPLLALFELSLGLLLSLPFKRLLPLLREAFKARSAARKRALFFDTLLHEVFIAFQKKYQPDFSSIFLNAGAHIQHHYLKDSSLFVKNRSLVKNDCDPILEMYTHYDNLLSDVSTRLNCDVILATGLSQQLFDQEVHYHRLSDHKKFLKRIGVNFSDVLPRMSRDFLVKFDSDQDRDKAHLLLSSLTLNGTKIFDHLDIRTQELFVTLTYPEPINDESKFEVAPFELSNHVSKDDFSFVAVKNAEHRSRGYLHVKSDKKIDQWLPDTPVHKINGLILSMLPE